MKKKAEPATPVNSPKKNPATQLIEKYRECIQKFCDMVDVELCPSEDISEFADKARLLINRKQGRARNEKNIQRIRNLKDLGLTVSEIVKETGIPATTVKRHYGPMKK